MLFALGSAGNVVFAAFVPEVVRLCDTGVCEVTQRPIDLVPSEDRAEVNASPAARAAFDAYIEQPLVRLAASGIEFIRSAPFAALLLGIGLAMRRLGGRGPDPLGYALPWLRRASIAAILWAFAGPLADSLQGMLFYPGTPAGPHWYFVFDLGGMGTALMLAVAVYAAIWALEAGLRAQRDLAEIV